jgi:hypothetical protein
MIRKFWAVRAVAGIQITIGGIVLVGAFVVLLSALGFLFNEQINSRVGGTSFGILVALGLFIAGLFIVAQGQILEVFLQIEENTRPPRAD